jgi:hypothetical protein
MYDYEIQCERMMRHYRRLELINKGVKLHPGESGDDYEDACYGFFQNCYHLKDWLINDPNFTRKTARQIEDYINATPSLSICADICNGTKHLKLLEPRSGSPPRLGDRHITVYEGGPLDECISIAFIVEHAGLKKEAFALATECVQPWETFMN